VVGFGLSAGWLGACWRFARTGPLSAASCLAGSLGAIHAIPYDLTPEQPGAQLWAAVSAGLNLRVRLWGPLAAELGAELVVPLVRHRFLSRSDREPVFQQSAVAGLAHLGAGVQF
jgi:hypothetical protein